MKKTILLFLITFLSFHAAVCFAQINVIYNFSSMPDGQNTHGSLITDSTFLYGTTRGGGTNNRGTIFKIMPDGSGYVRIYDFGAAPDGESPCGYLISDGVYLYGMTTLGGTNGDGTIYKIKPDGSGYIKLLDFDFIASISGNPLGSLFFDGTFLIGMTKGDGWNDDGTIFRIMPDGSNYSRLLTFNAATNGSYPYGSFYFDGVFLYATTFEGGANGYGCIFKIKPDGTNFSRIYDFAPFPDAINPQGDLIYDGTFLYGMTPFGGIYNGGTVFKIKPDGTGYLILHSFNLSTEGHYPYAGLTLVDNNLYGVTQTSIPDFGTLFTINVDGSGYAVINYFTAANGKYPYCNLLNFNGSLFGMTFSGGTNNYGTIFNYELSLSATEALHVDNKFQVFPNPFNNSIIIRNATAITLLDYAGKEILRQIISEEQTKLNTEIIPSGFYLLNCSDGNNTANFKLVKF